MCHPCVRTCVQGGPEEGDEVQLQTLGEQTRQVVQPATVRASRVPGRRPGITHTARSPQPLRDSVLWKLQSLFYEQVNIDVRRAPSASANRSRSSGPRNATAGAGLAERRRSQLRHLQQLHRQRLRARDLQVCV